MTKRQVQIQAMLLTHQANGCLTALAKWRKSDSPTAVTAVAALEARYIQLNAEADGLMKLTEQWDELGKHFEE